MGIVHDSPIGTLRYSLGMIHSIPNVTLRYSLGMIHGIPNGNFGYSLGVIHGIPNRTPGSETAAATQCPDPFLATFNNYTVDKGSGSQCGGVGYIHVCDDLKSIAVDYSVCSETIFYSCECWFEAYVYQGVQLPSL